MKYSGLIFSKERTMKTKKCGRCKEQKKLSEFNTCKTYADGLNTICKICARIRVKETKRRKAERERGATPTNLKERLFYHAIIDERDLDSICYLTYREVLEIFEKTISEK